MIRVSFALASLLTLLSGCDRPPADARMPRTVLLSDAAVAPGAATSLTGEVRQAQRARLSFDMPGRLATVTVQPGDTVAAGQVLATLDPEPGRLRLAQVQAEASAADAEAADRAEQLRQQQALFDDGVASQSTLASTRAAEKAARGKANAARAAAALAARDARHAAIVAPFAGRVASRAEEPGQDLAAGQTVLTLDGAGQAEIVAFVPRAMRATLHVEDEATAIASDGTSTTVRVYRIGDHADRGSTVETLFRPVGVPFGLIPGQFVQVRLAGAAADSLSIPLTAWIPGDRPGQDSVFVFDDANGQIHRRRIRVAGHLGDRVLVAAGLARGERVVSGGTAFLSDGQSVRAFDGASQVEGH
ncbi:efflux RND transporter periplasmic adaptor subunit [Luteibacter sp. PPL201]|uniref:Efflux RND transporter periplasmic adaptor subunit n=1 Tax=Luteibacter sahnii TaxID=3021977 RepID=A0ABT6BDB7_9GAMM